MSDLTFNAACFNDFREHHRGVAHKYDAPSPKISRG